jgi:hypothetical protein
MTALNSNVTNITADTWTQVWGGGIRDVTGLHDCKVDLMVQNRGSAPASVLVAVTYSDVAPTSDTDAGIIDRTQVGIGRILQQPNIAVPSGGCIWLKSSEDATCFVGGNLDDVDPPDWVEDGAYLDFDFENARYWIETYGARELTNYSGFTVGSASSRWAAVDGTYTEFGAGEPIITEDGLLTLPGYTNKCDCLAEPSQLLAPTDDASFDAVFLSEGFDSFDGGTGALFGVVDKTADLAAAGYGSIVPNGRAIEVDNRAGSGPALMTITGPTGNTNDHTSVVVAWSDTSPDGAVYLGLNNAGGKQSITAISPQVYAHTETPTGSTQRCQVLVNAGHRAWIALPGLFEGSAPPDGVIVPPASGGNVTSACAISLPTAGWYEEAGGTFVVDFVYYDGARILSLDDGTNDNRINLLVAGGGQMSLYSRAGGVEVCAIADGGVTPTAGDRIRAAFRVGENDFALSVNGRTTLTDTSGALASPTIFRHGGWHFGTDWLAGTFAETVYIPASAATPSDAELAVLSALGA